MTYPIENYCETADGQVFLATGLGPMLRWDCLTTSPVPVGVTAPGEALTLSATGTGGTITGDYYAFQRFVNERGAFSDLSPVSAVATATEATGFTYTTVPIPTQVNVKRRQLLRNTAGQANVFYVDVDTTDLTSTTFGSTKDDPALGNEIGVPLFAQDGTPIANTNGLPPTHKRVLCNHGGRMYAAVDATYDAGGVVVENGSPTVRGLGTAWPAALAGRFLYVVGATVSYEIASVDTLSQTLTLTANYADASNPYEGYAIRPPPEERKLVYYTQPGLPESWPAYNAISIPEDSDEITGLMAKGSFLFVLERRHIYRFTAQTDPAVDGFVFLAGNRGCVNQRSWVIAEDTAFMLDPAGIHAYTSGASEAASDPIHDVFRPDGDTPRINWTAVEQFHCAAVPDEEVLRWFVNLSGEYTPRWSLALDYPSKRWWIEEYYRPAGSSQTGTYEGRRRMYVGGAMNKTLLYSGRTLDEVDPTGGQTRGTVTGASLYRLTDTAQRWPPDLAGATVVIVGGTGAGQRRRITSVAGNDLLLRDPWQVLPDSTSVYSLGAVSWTWQSGWFRWKAAEESTPRRVEVVWEPVPHPATAVARVYQDFKEEPVVWTQTRSGLEAEGMSTTAGSADLVVDLQGEGGFAQQRIDSKKDLHLRGPRFVSIGLSGQSGLDPQVIRQVSLDGAGP